MLYIVGFGSGSAEGLTIEADRVIRECDIIVGYKTYTEIIGALYPNKPTLSTPMRQERERVELALERAKNENVALVCSGDPELYGMAGLAYQLNKNGAEIKVIAGVSAAFSGGAVLGSPLTNDMAIISLSDLLTPAEKIIQRLRLAAQGDLVIVLYNVSSKKRSDYLMKACDIILEYRGGETVCGYVKNIGREGEESCVLTLSELRELKADMFTTVYIGSSATQNIGGKMVTPRGYVL